MQLIMSAGSVLIGLMAWLQADLTLPSAFANGSVLNSTTNATATASASAARDSFVDAFMLQLWAWPPPAPLVSVQSEAGPVAICGDGVCTMSEVFEFGIHFGTTCPLDCLPFGQCTLPELGPMLNFTAASFDYSQPAGMFGVRRSASMPPVRCYPACDISQVAAA